jgi:hypothetical protein
MRLNDAKLLFAKYLLHEGRAKRSEASGAGDAVIDPSNPSSVQR